MDTNQLAGALSQVAGAIKPASEICLLWIDFWATCMTKSEWAAWMQAIGSLIAIGVAVAIPYWQKWHADRENFNRARQCLLLHCALVAEMTKLAEAAGANPGLALRTAHTISANLVAKHDSVSLPNLSLRQLAIWRVSRITAEQIDGVAQQIRDGRMLVENVLPALGVLMEASRTQLEEFGLRPDRDPAG